MNFLHGIEIKEQAQIQAVEIAGQTVVGIIGTAPDADPVQFPIDTPIVIRSIEDIQDLYKPANKATQGSLPNAIKIIYSQSVAPICIVVRVENGNTDDDTIKNIIIKDKQSSGDNRGVYVFLDAKNKTGYEPNLLIAPGFSHQIKPIATGGTLVANLVANELIVIATKLKGIAIIDGPSETDKKAIEVVKLYDSERVYFIEPAIEFSDSGAKKEAYSSSLAAALIVKSDLNNGFWFSPSNQIIEGILGTKRAIEFKIGDPTAKANLLNENNITTIIRESGFRLWGNRTATTTKKQWQFLSVRRTADVLNKSLLAGHLWAIDKNITTNYIREVTERVNEFIRQLISLGALINGKCWANPKENKPSDIQNGKISFNFDFLPPYPAEHIIFKSVLENEYLSEIIEE